MLVGDEYIPSVSPMGKMISFYLPERTEGRHLAETGQNTNNCKARGMAAKQARNVPRVDT